MTTPTNIDVECPCCHSSWVSSPNTSFDCLNCGARIKAEFKLTLAEKENREGTTPTREEVFKAIGRLVRGEHVLHVPPLPTDEDEVISNYIQHLEQRLEAEALCPICGGIHKEKSTQECLEGDRQAHYKLGANDYKTQKDGK